MDPSSLNSSLTASLLQQAIEQIEKGSGFDLEAFLAPHTEEASIVRAKLEYLEQAGLISLRTQALDADANRSQQRFEERYEIRETLGKGGMGTVYRGYDRSLNREVAIKMLQLPAALLNEDRHVQLRLNRFLTESRVLGKLDHPNIVPVHEAGIDSSGRAYFVMKLVEGQTLREIVAAIKTQDPEASKENSIDDLVRMVIQVCQALAFAHERDVIHRDLKPENIMIGRFGEVQVMDWGLAKDRDSDLYLQETGSGSALNRELAHASGGEDANHILTREGDVFGTPSFMSPEQANGKLDEISERTDVFGVGALLYFLLTGNSPYSGTGIKDVLRSAKDRRLSDPNMVDGYRQIPFELRAVCKRALAENPDRRYASVRHVAEDLYAYLGSRPGVAWRETPWSRVVKRVRRAPAQTSLAAGFLVTGLLGIFAYQQTDQLLAAQQMNRDRASLKHLKEQDVVRARLLASNTHGGPEQTVRIALADFAAIEIPLDGDDSVEHVVQRLRETAERDSELGETLKLLLRGGILQVLWQQNFTYVSAHARNEERRELKTIGGKLTVERILREYDDLVRLYPRLVQIWLQWEEDEWNKEYWKAAEDWKLQHKNKIDSLLSSEHFRDDSGTRFMLGSLYVATKQSESAMNAYRTAIQMDPGNYYALETLGLILTRNTRDRRGCDEGIRHLEAAVAVRPDSHGAALNLGTARVRIEAELLQAVRDLHRAIDAWPESGSAHYSLGLAHMAIANWNRRIWRALPYWWEWRELRHQSLRDAVEAFELAAEYQPGDFRSWFQLSLAKARLSRTLDGLCDFSRGLSLNPQRQELFRRKFAPGLAGKSFEEVRPVIEACTHHPDGYPYRVLGDIYRDLGQKLDATKAYEQFARYGPDFESLVSLGELYADLERLQEGLAITERLLVRLDEVELDAERRRQAKTILNGPVLVRLRRNLEAEADLNRLAQVELRLQAHIRE